MKALYGLPGSPGSGSPFKRSPCARRNVFFLAAALILAFSAIYPERLPAGPGQEEKNSRQQQEKKGKKKEAGTKTEETAKETEGRKTGEQQVHRKEDTVRNRDRAVKEARDPVDDDSEAEESERKDGDRRIHRRFPEQVREKRMEEPGGRTNFIVRPPREPKPPAPRVNVPPRVPPAIVPVRPHPPMPDYPEIIMIEHWYYEDDYGYYDDPLPDYIFDDYSDNEPFIIPLPFGNIIPWEVGELFLMKLKDIEAEGYGNSLMVCIIQTQDEMSYGDFLDRYRWDTDEFEYYDTLSGRSFLLSIPVSSALRLLGEPSVRWIGEYRPDYKIVQGPRNATVFVSSFEGDRMEFRRDLRELDLDVPGFDEKTGEYLVHADYDCFYDIADLWWVESVSSEPRLAAGLTGADRPAR